MGMPACLEPDAFSALRVAIDNTRRAYGRALGSFFAFWKMVAVSACRTRSAMQRERERADFGR
jgi:hypothetical protein